MVLFNTRMHALAHLLGAVLWCTVVVEGGSLFTATMEGRFKHRGLHANGVRVGWPAAVQSPVSERS